MDDINLGQLPLPPANAVQATETLFKHEVGTPGGRNGIGDVRDSPTSASALVGSPGTRIEICWQKGCDLQGREHSVALNMTLPNDKIIKDA